MNRQMFVVLTASRVETGPVESVAGALQQETRMFDGEQCICVLLVTFPPGSPEWMKWTVARTLDGMPAGRDGATASAPLVHHPI